jgi:hypothetical protein
MVTYTHIVTSQRRFGVVDVPSIVVSVPHGKSLLTALSLVARVAWLAISTGFVRLETLRLEFAQHEDDLSPVLTTYPFSEYWSVLCKRVRE